MFKVTQTGNHKDLNPDLSNQSLSCVKLLPHPAATQGCPPTPDPLELREALVHSFQGPTAPV